MLDNPFRWTRGGRGRWHLDDVVVRIEVDIVACKRASGVAMSACLQKRRANRLRIMRGRRLSHAWRSVTRGPLAYDAYRENPDAGKHVRVAGKRRRGASGWMEHVPSPGIAYIPSLPPIHKTTMYKSFREQETPKRRKPFTFSTTREHRALLPSSDGMVSLEGRKSGPVMT